MSDIKIQHKDNDQTGTFTANKGDEEIGLLTYNIIPTNVMDIYHTEVDEDAEGKGIGTRLVKAAIDFAGKNDLKIKPTCEFAKSFFEKNKDFADVLA